MCIECLIAKPRSCSITCPILYSIPRKHHSNKGHSFKPYFTPGTESWARFSATSNGGGMVATDNAVCSEIAADMLKGGGNAADAAVAAGMSKIDI